MIPDHLVHLHPHKPAEPGAKRDNQGVKLTAVFLLAVLLISWLLQPVGQLSNYGTARLGAVSEPELRSSRLKRVVHSWRDRIVSKAAIRFERETARNRRWRALERRPLDRASRSLQREFAVVIMVEVLIGEMFGSD